MENKGPKKYRYAWMSFSENEQPLLESYINEQAKRGYEIRKIARFYLRFKYSTVPLEPYYVQSYRSFYIGHLYWHFSHEPFPPKKSYGSRFFFHLGLLIFWTVSFVASLVYLWHFDWHLLYSDAALITALSLPCFSLSFLLDYLGRFWESCHYLKPASHSLHFARFRALFLGLNMILRYLLLLGLVLPMYLKELLPPVVFIIIAFASYEIAYYYLPHHHRLRLAVLACLMALFSCGFLKKINDAHPYHKDKIDYSQFEVMRLENFIDKQTFDDQQSYTRQIHRYTSTSLWVPLYYTRSEIMHPVGQSEPRYETYSAFSYCADAHIASELFWKEAAAYPESQQVFLDNDLWHADEIILIDNGHLLVLCDSLMMEFAGCFDFTNPKTAALVFELVQNHLAEPLTH